MSLFRIVGPHDALMGKPGEPPGPEIHPVHPGEEHPHSRVQRDRQDGGDGHGEVLGVSQRLEKTAFLIHQREDGHEGYGDDQKGEEDRRTHFLKRIQPDGVVVSHPPAGLPELQLLVGVLHLHDGAVHQHPDGDGDSSQRHDVGGDAHEIHGDESQDDGDGNGDDGDDGGRDVPKEDQDDQADDDHLQKQLFPQVRDGLFDQVRTVIGGNQIHSLGEGSLDAPDPLLDAVDDVEGVLAVAHHHDPPHRVPHPVQVH